MGRTVNLRRIPYFFLCFLLSKSICFDVVSIQGLRSDSQLSSSNFVFSIMNLPTPRKRPEDATLGRNQLAIFCISWIGGAVGFLIQLSATSKVKSAES